MSSYQRLKPTVVSNRADAKEKVPEVSFTWVDSKVDGVGWFALVAEMKLRTTRTYRNETWSNLS